MKSLTHKSKQNDTIIKVWYSEEKGLSEIWIKSIGDQEWTCVGAKDLIEAITKVKIKSQ